MADWWTEPIDSGPLPEDGGRYDIIVVGGGPGGSGAAMYASMAGHRVLLLEKSVFPRQKSCGDAVGGSALMHVQEFGCKDEIEATPCYQVTDMVFSSANGEEVSIRLPADRIADRTAGMVIPRLQFDHVLFKRATELVRENGGAVIQDFPVSDVHLVGKGDEQRIIGVSGIVGGRRSGNEVMTFTAPLTIGAGGYNCPVSRKITETHGEPMRDDDHYIAAYREYWEMECGKTGPIELHFIGGELGGGYFWIFPVREGLCNVGIGMVQRELKLHKTKLRALQAQIIAEHPKFKVRFESAKMVEGSGIGHMIPCGSPRKHPPSYQPRRIAMAGAGCVGDSATLVNAFSGEGIDPAFVSAKTLIAHFNRDEHADGFPSEAAHDYQVELWKQLGPVMTNSYKMQKLVKKRRLMNWFMGKAGKDDKRGRMIRDQLELAVSSKSAQEDVATPWQLIKLMLF
jgi:flavin-dependent dehydrogenase